MAQRVKFQKPPRILYGYHYDNGAIYINTAIETAAECKANARKGNHIVYARPISVESKHLKRVR